MSKGRKSSRYSRLPPECDDGFIAVLEANSANADQLAARHFAEPHISASQHRDARRIALGSEVLRKTRIYLDQRFWIFCRDSHLGRPQRPLHEQIWNQLCALVDSGKVICPVAYPVLVETFKQADLASRAATASVIDRLSNKVVVQPSFELANCELHHFILKTAYGTDFVHPLQQLAWTFPAWTIGQSIPHFPKLDSATNNALQKYCFDLAAEVPFSLLVQAGEDGSFSDTWDTEEHYRKLTESAREHQHEVTSFKSVFMSEVAGVLDTFNEFIPRLWARLFEQASGTEAAMTATDRAESIRLTRNLVYNAYRLNKLTTELPFIHIVGGLHAAVRHRKQPYKSGDHWDFFHAHQALPYCNAFFTERSLGSLLTSRPLEYDKAYACRVVWTDEDVVSFLNSL